MVEQRHTRVYFGEYINIDAWATNCNSSGIGTSELASFFATVPSFHDNLSEYARQSGYRIPSGADIALYYSFARLSFFGWSKTPA